MASLCEVAVQCSVERSIVFKEACATKKTFARHACYASSFLHLHQVLLALSSGVRSTLHHARLIKCSRLLKELPTLPSRSYFIRRRCSSPFSTTPSNDGNRAIEDLDFGDPHHPGVPEKSKATTFYLFCKTTAGERIIIEMQRVTQLFFYKRALYDWALEVTQQDKPHSEKEVVAQRNSKNYKKGEVIAKKAAWDYNFEPVYQFSVCDFPVFADDPNLKDAPLLRGLIHFNGNEPVLNYLAPLRLCFMQLPNFTLDNPRTSSPA